MDTTTLDGLIGAGVKKVSPGMVATIMGFTRQTIRTWVKAGKFPPEVFVKTLGRIVWFDCEKLRAWMANK